MRHAAHAASAQSARDRMAQTRRDLLRYMNMARGQSEAAAPDAPWPDQASPDNTSWRNPTPESAHSEGAQTDADSLWQDLRQHASSWWRDHPAHLALEVAQPVFEKYARAQPMKVLGFCAATGAVVVLIRPWRLISITGLLVAALKSAQMSALEATVLRASGPRSGTDRPR